MIEQWRNPRGMGGLLVDTLVARINTPVAAWGLRQLAFEPGHTVLHLGCRGGAHLRDALAYVPGGQVHGVDASALLLKRARRRCRREAARAQIVLKRQTGPRIPYENQFFDRGLSLNQLYFWSHPVDEFAELRRVLRPHGKLGVVWLGAEALASLGVPHTPTFHMHTQEEVRAALLDAGFKTVRLRTHRFSSGPRFCALAGPVG